MLPSKWLSSPRAEDIEYIDEISTEISLLEK